MKTFLPAAILALTLILFALLLGCTTSTNTQSNDSSNITSTPLDSETTMVAACKLKCEAEKNVTDFNNGPCLGVVADNWVCDIAHNPRESIDNNTDNQCSDYLTGKITHFIELTPNCEFIRAK